ncbi:MAG TPA: SOS response-associated peptidase [Pseudolabrys sp.]|nr:SOS response-associated peptidase [Pseudolabrys sp.]
MCGRYAVISAPEAIRALFGYPEQPNFPPRYNVAPTQPIAIVRLMDGKRQFALVRWGLLPSWVKDPKNFTLLINARGESVIDKPAFSAAMKRRRCLIPADGFYEWKAIGTRKQPYYVRAKSGQPLAFAGLWETWTGPNGEELETAAIVTTRAKRALADIHERMPVIVPPEAFNLWLDCANVDPETATALISPASESLLDTYEVSTAVNRTANDNPELIERYVAPAQAEAAPKADTPRAKRKKTNNGQASLF